MLDLQRHIVVRGRMNWEGRCADERAVDGEREKKRLDANHFSEECLRNLTLSQKDVN